MDKQKPNISVIVPIYNVEPFLRRCVASLLRQTYRDFELILVDDGSPDNCGAICDTYAEQDDRIKVIHKANGGLSDARNAGLAIAQGEYISFVDSDDWVSPDYLKRMMDAIQTTGADICECSICRTEHTDVTLPERIGEAEVYKTTEALKQLICDRAFHQHVWNKLYRRDTIGNILFPKGKVNEDEFWTYQVFGNAENVAKIPDVLYYYYQRPGSIMGADYSIKRLDALEAKRQRQQYVERMFSQLAEIAKSNLTGSCIYAGQMSLRKLKGEEFAQAKKKINDILQECPINLREVFRSKGHNRIWVLLAWLDFWQTCKLRNYMKKGL